MAEPTRIINRISRLLREWWDHRGSFVISLLVTLFALATYYVTFVGERPMPMADFVNRMELSSLDTRFQFRGRMRTDPRIIIVDVDQESQELLGRWPFPRIHFAHLLDALREDGARVVAFDMTFSKPDQTVLPLQDLSGDLAARAKKGPSQSAPRFFRPLKTRKSNTTTTSNLLKPFSALATWCWASYFLYTKADLAGVSSQALDEYANLIAYLPFSAGAAVWRRLEAKATASRLITTLRGPELSAARRRSQCRDFHRRGCCEERRGLLQRVSGRRLGGAPRAAGDSLWPRSGSRELGFLRVARSASRAPVSRSERRTSSAELRRQRNRQRGIRTKNNFVRTDDISRLLVNYHGPARTYPYVSFADVALKKFSARHI